MTSPESVATNGSTYDSILEARMALNRNATIIPSAEGGSIHGHLALVFTNAEYLAVAGVIFVPPVQPGPFAHTLLATTTQIIETNHLHKSATDVFQIYHAVDQALRKLLIAATLEVYICAIKGRIHSLALACYNPGDFDPPMHHVWRNHPRRPGQKYTLYGGCLKSPHIPIENIFEQLQAGAAFATEGGDAPSAPRVVWLWPQA
eukprot:scaffold2553_cov32-Attheya_sp.AAC.1